MTEISDIDIREDPCQRHYFLIMPDGEEAHLTLLKTSPTNWVASHTFVPEAHRGGDIASTLVARMISDARKEGARIRPTCSYVAAEFGRHAPDWDDLRA